jgi:hypothetical protein
LIGQGAPNKNLLHNCHGIQHKNAKHEIEGGDKRLFLGLCSYVLEKLQPKNEEETHIIYTLKPYEIFFPKIET